MYIEYKNKNINAYKPLNYIPTRQVDRNYISIRTCPCDTVSFSGKKTNRKDEKKIENLLKNIDGLHDPYSDIIMLPKNKYQRLQHKISHQTTAKETVNLLSKQTNHMFSSDVEMLGILSKHANDKYTDINGNTITTDFHTILKNLKPEARDRLINSQLNVTDTIRYISRERLPESSQKEVESYLTIIEKDIHHDRFRIKQSRSLLERLYDEVPEKEVIDDIMKETLYFPNTATSTDAFIVKNADKTHAQIADLLISPGLISIEHIKPSSEKGKNSGANYLAASKRMNNLRCSMPMDQFIELFPRIPECTQRYMDDLIKKINNDKIEPVAYLLGDVKETLYKESKGQIDVDISGVKPDITKKVRILKNEITKLINTYNPNSNNKF